MQNDKIDPEKLKKDREELEKRQREGGLSLANVPPDNLGLLILASLFLCVFCKSVSCNVIRFLYSSIVQKKPGCMQKRRQQKLRNEKLKRRLLYSRSRKKKLSGKRLVGLCSRYVGC